MIRKKGQKFAMLLIVCLILVPYVGFAKKYDQLIRTKDGKYVTVTLNTSSVVNNSFTLNINTDWIDKNLNSVVDKTSVLVLKKENLNFTNSEFVSCKALANKDVIAFNKSKSLEFDINPEFKGGQIIFDLAFEYASDIENKENSERPMFTQPKNVSITKQIDISEIITIAQKAESVNANESANEVVLSSDVDIDIPDVCLKKNSNRFALIIGNEDYSSFQMGLNSEVDVDYAINDAKAFKMYATNVLCIPEDNIIYLENAKAIEMHRSIKKLSLLSEITQGQGELFFYYAGHGFPDELTKEPYLIPVDVSGNDLQFAINLKDLYAKITQYPHKSVTVFLDACFSGGARNQGLLAARGVKIIPKNNDLFGNLVVFSASSGQESSLPYHDKQHGLFTYCLLKKLKESNGEVNYRELGNYLKTEVAKKSILKNDKPQHPQVNVSPSAQNLWSDWKIKN